MAVKDNGLLGQLEERCREQGVKITYGQLQGEGGLCRLRESHIIIINNRASNATRARIIAEALMRLETAAEKAEKQPESVEAGCPVRS